MSTRPLASPGSLRRLSAFKVGYDPALAELYVDCRACHTTVVTVPGFDYTLHRLVEAVQSHRCPARTAGAQ